MSDSVRGMSCSAPPSPAQQTTYSGTPSRMRMRSVGAPRSRYPDLSTSPVTNSSPRRSMRPLPQIPTAAASSIVRNVGSSVSSAMKTSSMAPPEARMPWPAPPPSKAGPAEQAHESNQSLVPSTISPLVPMSMNRVSLSVANIPEEMTPAVMSPPT